MIKPKGKPVLVSGSDSRKPYRTGIDELEDIDDEEVSDSDDDDSWLD